MATELAIQAFAGFRHLQQIARSAIARRSDGALHLHFFPLHEFRRRIQKRGCGMQRVETLEFVFPQNKLWLGFWDLAFSKQTLIGRFKTQSLSLGWPWWKDERNPKPSAPEAPSEPFPEASIIDSTLHVVKAAANVASDTAVGAEQREAVYLENEEIWRRVEEGDALWSLSCKYLGEGHKWPHLQGACRKELGSDPLHLLPGSRVTKA